MVIPVGGTEGRLGRRFLRYGVLDRTEPTTKVLFVHGGILARHPRICAPHAEGHCLLIVWGRAPLLGVPGRSLRQPSAIQDATSAPIASCCRTATTSLLMLSARFLTDGTLCEAEAGPSRPPVELGSTLGVRQLCAHPGWGRARCR